MMKGPTYNAGPSMTAWSQARPARRARRSSARSIAGLFCASTTTSTGCGCAAGALLKCFALLPQLRGQNLLGRLVSALTQDRFAAGYYDLMVITRAHNETLFVNSGFWTVAKTEQLVLLENQPWSSTTCPWP